MIEYGLQKRLPQIFRALQILVFDIGYKFLRGWELIISRLPLVFEGVCVLLHLPVFGGDLRVVVNFGQPFAIEDDPVNRIRNETGNDGKGKSGIRGDNPVQNKEDKTCNDKLFQLAL